MTATETIQHSIIIIREALGLNGRTPWYKASIDFSVRNIKEFFSNFCLGHRSNTSSESRGREGRVFPEREGSGRDLKHEWWV